jgi:UV DNA damage repair endonuclease
VDEELRQVERDSIKDYISEAENLSTLHGNLKRCDEYLLKLEQVSAQILPLLNVHCPPRAVSNGFVLFLMLFLFQLFSEIGALSKEFRRHFKRNSRIARQVIAG